MPLGEGGHLERQKERGACAIPTSAPCIRVSLQRSPEGATQLVMQLLMYVIHGSK